jgi:RsiW-degrading membrane proteinase PrsW (M82 family)
MRKYYPMIVILFPIAFIPMLVFLFWIRGIEKYNKELWIHLFLAFIWGAAGATVLSLLIESYVSVYIPSFFILSVCCAPVIEEIAKAIGLPFVRNHADELEDGLIYGATIGLGFAATENMIYGMRFWDEGILVLISLFYIRTVSSALLHASATALVGYGVGKYRIHKTTIFSLMPYFLIALGAHTLFNVFAYSAIAIQQVVGVVLGAVFATTLFAYIRKQIITWDLHGMKQDMPVNN